MCIALCNVCFYVDVCKCVYCVFESCLTNLPKVFGECHDYFDGKKIINESDGKFTVFTIVYSRRRRLRIIALALVLLTFGLFACFFLALATLPLCHHPQIVPKLQFCWLNLNANVGYAAFFRYFANIKIIWIVFTVNVNVILRTMAILVWIINYNAYGTTSLYCCGRYTFCSSRFMV